MFGENKREAWTKKVFKLEETWRLELRLPVSQYFDDNPVSESGVPALPFPNWFRFTESDFLDPICYLATSVFVQALV